MTQTAAGDIRITSVDFFSLYFVRRQISATRSQPSIDTSATTKAAIMQAKIIYQVIA